MVKSDHHTKKPEARKYFFIATTQQNNSMVNNSEICFLCIGKMSPYRDLFYHLWTEVVRYFLLKFGIVFY